jgi:uncharacterized protein YrrD
MGHVDMAVLKSTKGGYTMLKNVKELIGYDIHATDGNIGEVYDFYFDDQSWCIRYMVVNTGRWLSGRRVLIASAALGKPDWGKEIFSVSLTREQVRHSPNTNIHEPISRQHEHELHEYYGWPRYWGYGTLDTEMAIAEAEYEAMAAVEEEEKEGEEENTKDEEAKDSHLQSMKDVTGYHIHAADGQIGHVADFVVDDESWAIRYIIVDTRNWLPGKKVLVSPHWTESVNWSDSEVFVELSREAVKSSPEFDPSAPVNRDYEDRLYDYYGRRKYWTEEVRSIVEKEHKFMK